MEDAKSLCSIGLIRKTMTNVSLLHITELLGLDLQYIFCVSRGLLHGLYIETETSLSLDFNTTVFCPPSLFMLD